MLADIYAGNIHIFTHISIFSLRPSKNNKAIRQKNKKKKEEEKKKKTESSITVMFTYHRTRSRTMVLPASRDENAGRDAGLSRGRLL